jgi:hypothetical protein
MASRTLMDGAPLRTTKQMLDELDALMERMLALPVNDPEECLAPPPLAARLTRLDPPEPVVPPMNLLGPPPAAEVAPSDPLRRELPIRIEPLPEVVTNRLPPPTLLPAIELMLDTMPEPNLRPTFWAARPLLWLNQGFDNLAGSLGDFGRGLCTGLGRAALGAAGLAMLTLAVCWGTAEWLGWPW